MTSALATDLYQLTMMAGYVAAGHTGPSTFELFVRELPQRRAYLVVAGIEQAVDYLESLAFTPPEIAWLRESLALEGVPARFFDEVLPTFRFTGEVWSVDEGEVVFSHEPILRVTAPAAEAQLVETALLAFITFQTSVASKASRIVDAAGGREVVEFGTRRAHGLEAARYAARASYLAGCAGTSNVEASWKHGVPAFGTMAHSWVMSFGSEVQAFREYMRVYGERTTLLIDTYDTPVAARAIVAAGLHPAAVRLDSGDLDALSRAVRGIFDAGGLTDTRILASGDLDEYKIQALVHARAPIDAFGVGTSLSTVSDAPALGGIYKLVETTHEGVAVPVAKLSTGKRTYPGRKQVWRVTDRDVATHDVLGLVDEPSEGRPLLRCVMHKGRRLAPTPSLDEMRSHCRARIEQLPASVRALDATEGLPVRVGPALDALARAAAKG